MRVRHERAVEVIQLQSWGRVTDEFARRADGYWFRRSDGGRWGRHGDQLQEWVRRWPEGRAGQELVTVNVKRLLPSEAAHG